MEKNHDRYSYKGNKSVECLKQNFICIITDSASKRLEAEKSCIELPIRKFLPMLGEMTFCMRIKNEEDKDTLSTIEDWSNDIRLELM